MGISVIAAIGDNQASLLGTVEDPDHELVLTLGMGGQLSAAIRGAAAIPDSGENQNFEYRPFVEGRQLGPSQPLCAENRPGNGWPKVWKNGTRT